jgi:hypothetical protein
LGAVAGLSATLSGKLMCNGRGVSGKTLLFIMGSTIVGQGITDANGNGSSSYSVATYLGGATRTVTVRFIGDPSYSPSDCVFTLTVLRNPTLSGSPSRSTAPNLISADRDKGSDSSLAADQRWERQELFSVPCVKEVLK